MAIFTPKQIRIIKTCNLYISSAASVSDFKFVVNIKVSNWTRVSWLKEKESRNRKIANTIPMCFWKRSLKYYGLVPNLLFPNTGNIVLFPNATPAKLTYSKTTARRRYQQFLKVRSKKFEVKPLKAPLWWCPNR